MYIFNGINSRNYDKITLILRDKHTIVVDKLPKVDGSIAQEASDILYSLLRDDFDEVIKIFNRHNFRYLNTSLSYIREITKVIKNRSERIEAFGYLLQNKLNKNVVVEFKNETNDRSLVLMAVLYGLLVRSSCIISHLDLSKLEIRDILPDKYDKYDYDENYVRMLNKDIESMEGTGGSSKTKERHESKPIASKDLGLLGRLKFEHLPISETFKLKETSLYDITPKVYNNDTLYCKIDVNNDYDTVALNMVLLSFINTVTGNKINNVLAARDALSTTVDTNSNTYRKLSYSAYELIEYWRNSNIKQLASHEYQRYMYMMARDYSKLIKSPIFRIAFINAFMQLYGSGSITLESGLLWHNIILSAIHRLNSVPEGIAGYYVVALTFEKLEVDIDLYLTTLAIFALRNKQFNGVIILNNVKYLPVSKDDIEEKEYIKNTESRKKVSTVAKEASNEISETLFNGESLGLYRDNQFNKNFSIVMSTTFDEIEQLWKTISIVRPGFNTDSEVVTIPTIFADVKGVGDQSESEYIRVINRLSEVDHCKLYVDRHIKKEDKVYGTFEFDRSTLFESNSTIYDGDITRERLEFLCRKQYPQLNARKCSLIVNKTEEACRLGVNVLKGVSSSEIVQEVMTLPNKIIDNIIWFDFTKRSPKVIMLFIGREILNKSDCITLYLLNLIGFDIVVFNPTAYAGLDGYLDASAFESYDLGEPRFNINYKKTDKKKGFIAKLFG